MLDADFVDFPVVGRIDRDLDLVVTRSSCGFVVPSIKAFLKGGGIVGVGGEIEGLSIIYP